MTAAHRTEVLVIGGGATGAGVARDSAMRGFATVLVERGELASGTTGRYHGQLHSGARYVVSDPESAGECVQENRVLRRIATPFVEDTGGLFVCTRWDDPAFGEDFVAACRAVGVRVEELSVSEALRREPRLHPGISRAFSVPDDAAMDARATVAACARSAEEDGARILPRHEVLEILTEGGAAVGVRLSDRRGVEQVVLADFCVNAAGAWAGRVAGTAGCTVSLLPSRGTMVAKRPPLVSAVVSRCRPPSDGDILVPVAGACVMGTTDVEVESPDRSAPSEPEVSAMLEAGEQLVPGFREAPAQVVWGAIRPLFEEESEGADTGQASRSYDLLDHADRDGIERLLTITGGKVTSFRAMAEATVDALCARHGLARACRTTRSPFRASASLCRPTHRLALLRSPFPRERSTCPPSSPQKKRSPSVGWRTVERSRPS